jgi:hypothetical protein
MGIAGASTIVSGVQANATFIDPADMCIGDVTSASPATLSFHLYVVDRVSHSHFFSLHSFRPPLPFFPSLCMTMYIIGRSYCSSNTLGCDRYVTLVRWLYLSYRHSLPCYDV